MAACSALISVARKTWRKPLCRCLDAQGDQNVRAQSSFSLALLAERKATAMPPFAHLALFRAEADKPETGIDFLRAIGAQCAHANAAWERQIDCLGPMPCPMEKRAGRYRSQLLLKSDSRAVLQAMLEHLIQTIEAQRVPAKLRWSLDVDPQELI